MRSVFVHLRTATAGEVEAWLERNYRFQSGPPWIVAVNGDPCLYVNVYAFEEVHVDPEDHEAVSRTLGGRPTAVVQADVSGRHPGDEQVRNFVTAVLTAFSGLAQDDYTRHGWTLDEIREERRVDGHPFFDYRGWYEAEADDV